MVAQLSFGVLAVTNKNSPLVMAKVFKGDPGDLTTMDDPTALLQISDLVKA